METYVMADEVWNGGLQLILMTLKPSDNLRIKSRPCVACPSTNSLPMLHMIEPPALQTPPEPLRV
jgi:hypothetical protein